VKYGSLQIILLLCFIIILLIVGYIIYNMESVRGERSFSIYHGEDSYLFSTLKYEGHEIDVIIDTGSQRSILLEDTLDIIPYKIYRGITIDLTDIRGNITTAQKAKVRIVEFGKCKLRNFNFIISSDIFNFDLDGVQGVVGIDILKHYDMRFNTTNYILKLEKPNTSREDQEIWNSRDLIEEDKNRWGFHIYIGDKKVFAVIDTGSPEELTIPTTFQKDIDWIDPTDEELSLYYFRDDDDMFLVTLKEVVIFDEKFENFSAIMNPGLDHILIGLDLLSEFDLIISFKRKKIYFKK